MHWISKHPGLIAIIFSLGITFFLKELIAENMTVIDSYHREEIRQSHALGELLKESSRKSREHAESRKAPIALLGKFQNSGSFDWGLKGAIYSQLGATKLEANFLESNYAILKNWIGYTYLNEDISPKSNQELFIITKLKETKDDSLTIRIIPWNTGAETLERSHQEDRIKFILDGNEMSYRSFISYTGDPENLVIKSVNSVTCRASDIQYNTHYDYTK